MELKAIFFSDEVIETQRNRDVPKVTQMVTAKAMIRLPGVCPEHSGLAIRLHCLPPAAPGTQEWAAWAPAPRQGERRL